ncbi:hypothetical protein EZV62_027209 [Acer yangbiense]|uniref:MULE transposase domain-containing protein n=1 Tax=Acer yangbiense TaxID=1000413 RepID=A0A5C7GTK8_9ROSI|nr:hypothetical protein EZV62_027209 [Acer yangbiense]
MLGFDYVDRVVDVDLIEPGDCSVISLINDTKKADQVKENKTDQVEENKANQVEEDNVVLIEQNSEEDNDVHFPEENKVDQVQEDNVVLVEQNNEEENVGGDAVNDGSDNCSVDNEYEVGEESEDDSDVSLVYEYDDEDYGNKDHCEPDGDETAVVILGNAKFTREVFKRYAIQVGFTLKKIKNDRNLKGGHSMCPRVAENKEVTSRWVASVLGNVIRLNPNGKAKSLKNELQERFAMKVDTQTIYRAKKIVLENLKSHHVEAYAKLRKYGNAIRSYNPGTDVLVAMNPDVELDNPTFLRFYLSFKACQLGFLNGYRSLIESWIWFLRQLRDSLGWDDSRRICFISDRQKGLLKALAKEWPNAYTWYCFRHIVANFMATFKNHKINWKLWQMARAAN